MKNRQKKQEKLFSLTMRRKLVILFTVVLLAFLGLSVRLIMINTEKGEQYKKQVLSQQKYDSRVIPYKRGGIVDSKGTTLAISKKVYNVILDSYVLNYNENQKAGCIDATVAALKQCFEIDEAAIRTQIRENADSRYYIIAKKKEYDEIQGFSDMMNDKDNTPNICGVWFEDEYVRYYPMGTLACDVLGFTNSGNAGAYGLEEYYNDVLNGTNGREYGYLNDELNLERTTKPATDGNTLVTTIDANIQRIVEEKIFAYNEAQKNVAREGLGSNNTGCIVMDVDSGEILAMASYPNFDLNQPKDMSAYYTPEAIAQMETDGTFLETAASYWKNFCISETYEPGSVAKPFTVAAGLDSGKIIGNETYFCGGKLEIGGHKIKCHNRWGDGEVNIATAVAESCNVAHMLMGRQMGKDVYLKYFQQYNFGLKTNIDLTGEARTDSLVYNEKTMGDTELATSTFGQGYNVTMIQMITAFCSLINGGYYYEPHMVSQILSADGAVVENIEPRILKQTVSATTSAKIIEYCNGVVTNGTGTTARPAGYAIGGKTGTAETSPRGTVDYVVSFMGYAPADNPQIAIYVVIDRPNMVRQDTGTRFATVMVRDILTEVLPYLNIYMTEQLSEDEITELKEKGLYESAIIKIDETPDDTEPNSEEGSETEHQKITPTIDPETGYAIDPDNGEFLDPETGAPIDPTSSFMQPIE